GPQVYWGALFCVPSGFSFTALRVSTLVLGLVAVIGLYALSFTVWRDRRLASLAAAALMVNPIFFALANTFMTDVPYLASCIVSLVLLVCGLRDDRVPMLVAGLVVCWIA